MSLKLYTYHFLADGLVANISFHYSALEPHSALRIALAITRDVDIVSGLSEVHLSNCFSCVRRVGNLKVSVVIYPIQDLPETFYHAYSSPVYDFITKYFKSFFAYDLATVADRGLTYEPLFTSEEQEGF